jgi:hypothetical protein
MHGSIGLPTSRQRSTESIERGSANHLAGSIEKSGIRAAANDARESLGFQHEQKRRRAGTAIYANFLGPIETELLAAA